MKFINKAILPKGFLASGISCGIKRSGKPDLALFYSQEPAHAAGVFTKNTMKAAPVRLAINHLKAAKTFRAIIANSGNANCFTGKTGERDALRMTKAASVNLGVPVSQILLASTGIIGKRLPLEKITSTVPLLVSRLSRQDISTAARALLTTDTVTKEVSVRFAIGRRKITLCAVAKGAGMIAPDMATMLCFILTDAAITSRSLNKALKQAVDNSFHCITVDGCMSTNDSVIILANARAGNKTVDSGGPLALFTKALSCACSSLAQKIVLDAEGAHKFITVEVKGAANGTQARTAAFSIANSSLFKTAMFGGNPNYGRIVAAVGATGVAAKESSLKIWMSALDKKNIVIRVDLGMGKGQCRVWTSDLTPEYVKINAKYS